jgi:predicted O-methyltransferase YrrM
MNIKDSIKKILYSIPIIGNLYRENKTFKTHYPPGHYANPFPSLDEVQRYSDNLFDNSKESIPGVNLNLENQISLLNILSTKYNEIPYNSNKNTQLRYSFNNPMFCESDGIFLWLIINHFKPRKIIEIGSGYSSALMLDINDNLMEGTIDLTFIDPYTEKLKKNLRIDDNSKATIIEKPIQDVDIKEFKKLKEDDILFLDTSHISKTGCDLNYDLFEILPSLNKGVIIHIHDIFFPFEYPKEWVLQQKAYNEVYLIRSFLMYNDSFEIIIFPNYLMNKKEQWFKENMPICLKNTGGSIWLRKIK